MIPRAGTSGAYVGMLFLLIVAGCAHQGREARPARLSASGNALDATAADIARGREVFLNTPVAARGYVPTSALRCASCHAHEGRKDHALALNGAHRRYPRRMDREDRTRTLQDRIRGCFERSENGSAPPDDSPEMRGLVAFIASLPAGVKAPPATLAPARRRPITALRPERGRALFEVSCTPCHGRNGQGAGPFPPLWGERSYNDGAGLGQIYKMAAFIHAAMPLNRGGSLTEDEAQDLAAYINTQPRAVYARKKEDYPRTGPPVDAVYYRSSASSLVPSTSP